MADKRRKPIVDPRAAEKRRSLLMKIGAAVVLVALAIGIGVWVLVSNKSATGSSSDVTVATNNAYRITTAPKGTTPPVTLTVVEDFQCPACRAFETQFSDAMEQIRNNPKVAVDYMPIAFLDRMSTTNYSSRSANASACVAQSTAGDGNFDTWLKFHNALYAQQPEEGGAGLTNDELNSIAKQAGATNLKQCIDDEQFSAFVKDTTQKALDSGVNATPTIKINGNPVQLSTPDALIAAVNEAANKQ
ncbi:DsbA family protein [Gordonia otitidis]|uniref:Oxidoreductase n=1 Tax=Gordonia otitidis (strain DSM 44809 / CCUG 52243 / JCM 12355 / NBRC 100426 / IFM 10032) TaxID=1108044 RepID=H5TFZ3_GORO1|nr:DsbA family protein [Gordonia otitidis]UEA58064.1 DsbA family protein [Gordonia otitidis]GAB32401.1 putative oxidoreductase [Gordonia otitidis NBRC 100426]